MASSYFDTNTKSGFTMRVFWEEKNGTVTPTDLRVRSTVYGGKWFPGGTIKIDGITALTMDYSSPATHSFHVYGVGEDWLEVSGDKPASVGPITDKAKATITVEVELYRDSSTSKPKLTGSAEIPLTTGLVRVKTAGGVKRCRAYVVQGGVAAPAAAVAKQNGNIKYCT